METDKLMDELTSFLQSKSTDLRSAASQQILGLLSDETGLKLVSSHDGCWHQLIQLACNDDERLVRKSGLQCLINLSSDDDLAGKLTTFDDGKLVKECLRAISLKESAAFDWTMLLSNLTRSHHNASLVWDVMKEGSSLKLETTIQLICTPGWDHLAQVLCNLSQLNSVRKELTNKDQAHIKPLLRLMGDCRSHPKRKGIVGTVRNCCFDVEAHSWLLSEDVDIVTALVYPLAGPEELDEDENDKLPLELQYLEAEKERESDPEIRKMLLEALLQLCAMKVGRLTMKEKGIYYLMRELHKWEEVKVVLVACENLVDILIGDEPGSEMENLKRLDIPSDLQEKFKRMDEEDK